MSIIKEFKTFIAKGNVLDLAVAVVIGGAFGKIVSSLVADIIMPPIGLILGGVNFTDLKINLKGADIDASGKVIAPAVTLNYGNFVQAAIDFLIVAFAVFMFVKVINMVQKKKDAAPAPPAPPTKQEELLTEIRDLLKK